MSQYQPVSVFFLEQNKQKLTTEQRKSDKQSWVADVAAGRCVFPLVIHGVSEVLGTVLPLKAGYVKLALASFVVHVADLSKNISLCPALVMDTTDRPHTTWTGDGGQTLRRVRVSVRQ